MKILIVDDHLRVRSSLKALLAAALSQAEMSEAADGAEAIHRIEESHPDLVLMDARMPNLDGIRAIGLIKARWQKIQVIVLSMYAQYQVPALEAGAAAFISKDESPEKLLNWVICKSRTTMKSARTDSPLS